MTKAKRQHNHGLSVKSCHWPLQLRASAADQAAVGLSIGLVIEDRAHCLRTDSVILSCCMHMTVSVLQYRS